MNYPVWDIPAGGLLIAAIAILHVFVSHFAVGGGLFLVLVERKARRDGDDALLAYVRQHSRFFILLTLVFGAITGVGIWFTIGLVHPAATSSLISTFVWGWAIEWTFFVTEIAAAMVYYYGWDRLPARVHLAVGWVYFVSAWLSLVVINGILTYMLTPGAWITTRGFWDGFFNETYWPAMFARTFVAVGLAGLYAMWTAAGLRDVGLKARVVRLAAWWVLAAAVSVPLTLAWFLSAASGAGVPVAGIFGATGGGVGSLIAAVFGTTTTGYPVAQRAAFWLVLSAIALVAATILAVNRGGRLGRPLAALMLAFGVVAMGGGEFVREALRKPYVIGHYMLVSGVRLPDPPGVAPPPADHAKAFGRDRFTIDALNESGVIAASAWVRPVPDSMMAPAHYAERAAHQGRELFRTLCAACHTIDGYLAIRPLVRGKGVDAIDGMLGRLAMPVDASGAAVSWNVPALQLKTWRDRRMPPFVGTAEERRLLAAHLAMIGGASPDAVAEPAASAGAGQKYYDANCAACHAPDGMAPFDHQGRPAATIYEMIGRLPEINEMMPAFEGTDDERRALAEHLASLPRPPKKGRCPVIPPIPQPDPVPLPAPAWLLWALLLLTFYLHLIPMNLVLGGSILGAIARVRARRGDRPHDAALAHLVVKAMPVLISAAVSMGVAALLFLQVLYGRLFFPSAIVMGWWWLAVIGLLILAYYGAYLLAMREHSLGGVSTLLAWVIAAVVGLIALIYGNNMTMMLKPQELVSRYLSDGGGVQLNLLDPTLFPRHLHMLLGAIAVSGLAAAVVGVARRRREPAFGDWAVKYGAVVCGLATSVNMFVGLWWLAALPREVLVQFMRGGIGIVGVLLAGILLTIASAAHLMLAAGGRKPGVNVGLSAASMLAGLAMMLGTRDAVRSASLGVAGFQPVAWTVPQWGPIVIFFVLLVAAVATVWWMVRALVKAG